MFQTFITRSLTLITAVLSLFSARAAHIIGGELYYDYLGNNEYLVTLKLYRDCFSSGAAFDAQGRLTVFTGDGQFSALHNIPFPGSTLVPITLDSPCLTLPPNLCVETTSYSQIIMLPANGIGYTLTFQRCCREPSTSNIVNPNTVGITCTVRVPPLFQLENRSPRFNDLPPAAVCLNENLVFNHSASDPDGDELVYSLITPLLGGSQGTPYPLQSDPPPYYPVTWSAGFSETYQMPSDPPMAIDPVTGILTVRPSALGNYVIGISVKEYRNGELLSEAIRDYRFAVVPCDAAVTAAVLGQQNSTICAGLTIPFVNQSSGATSYSWDFGDPGTMDDTSSVMNPVWTYAQQGTYTVTLIANPGTVCADTATGVFAAYIPPVPYFTPPDPTCGPNSTLLVAEGSFGPTATINWDLGQNANPTTAQGIQAQATFAVGVQPVTVNVIENGCAGSFTANVVAWPVPAALFTVDPQSPQLAGTPVSFTNLSSPNGSTIVEYAWSVDNLPLAGTSTGANWVNTLPGVHTLALTVTSADGCSSTYYASYTMIAGEVIIPNVFSPNNDGWNDAFVIENAQYLPNTLAIFNRWGMPIYETQNYRNTWRATDVPDGTYYYVFTLTDGREFTGHVTLLR
jgi:gliding motility-associated-like protein